MLSEQQWRYLLCEDKPKRTLTQEEHDAAYDQLRYLASDADDREWNHRSADGVLLDVLRLMGYDDLVEAFNAIPKWYA